MQGYSKRTQIIVMLMALVYAVLVIELLKKTVFASPYYQRLSDSNAIRQVLIPAPRGVFYDRNGKPLVNNDSSKRYQYVRAYPYHELYAHVIGYMGLPSDKTLKDRSCPAPARSNQFVGVYGLEQVFECRLRGIPGARYLVVDAQGGKKVELAQQEPRRGEDIHLTFDTHLQETAQRSLQGKRGGVMASNPQTGELLVFYSSPSFDVQQIVRTPSSYAHYASDEAQPLFNRLVSGTYPPGSVVKPVLAIGALESGVITGATEIEDTGVLTVGGTSFGNWYFLQYGKKEGQVDVVKAIGRSNDIFFYTVGIRGGEKKLTGWLEDFHYDRTDMQDYFTQARATLPSDTWKRREIGEQWYLGDTINLAIGQGYLLVTPAQVHAATAMLATGRWCPFSVEQGQQQHCVDLHLNQEHLQLVQEGMRRACSTGGTGWPLFDFTVRGKKISVGCKTGTAESTGADQRDPHAWFTVFAPFENPTIAITVLVEHGGEGSSVAAPIAKDLLTAYFMSL